MANLPSGHCCIGKFNLGLYLTVHHMGDLRMHSLVIDITGQQFGKLTALDYIGSGKWRCSCDCGNETIIRGANLKNGHCKSCGCIIDVEDLTGRKFGKLIALKLIKKPDRFGRQWPYWECTCDCGKTTTVLARSLKSGSTQSCGCLIGEVQRGDARCNARKTKHCINELQRTRRASGLCRCGNKPQLGFKICDICRRKSSERQKEFRLQRLQDGLCICGRPLVPDKRKCEECLKRYSSNSWERQSRRLKNPSLLGYCGQIARNRRDDLDRLIKRGITSDRVTGEQIMRLWQQQDGLCALSGLPMLHKYGSLESCSIDRKDSNVGYTYNNMQLVCKWANYGKNKYTDGEFKLILNKIRAQGTKNVT